MSLATATVAITDWMAAQLAARPELAGVRVFVAAAGAETPRPVRGKHGPYVTLRQLGADDWYYLGGRLGGSTVTVEVSAWDEGTDAGRLAPLIEAAHAALQGQRGSAGDVRIVACLRAAPVERQIDEDDRLYTQLGGEYRVRASMSA